MSHWIVALIAIDAYLFVSGVFAAVLCEGHRRDKRGKRTRLITTKQWNDSLILGVALLPVMVIGFLLLLGYCFQMLWDAIRSVPWHMSRFIRFKKKALARRLGGRLLRYAEPRW